jgi:hypothetical protein
MIKIFLLEAAKLLGQTESNNFIQMITITDYSYIGLLYYLTNGANEI